MNRKMIPRCDALEGRAVPATFGIPWHDPTHLSLSFAPDGSGMAAHQSRLFEALDSQASPSE